MNHFRDIGKNAEAKNFIGDKIPASKLLNRQIEILDFKIVPSKLVEVFGEDHKDCMHMQVKWNGRYYIVFTSSKYLMEEIKTVDKNRFPFIATIEEVEMRYKFS